MEGIKFDLKMIIKLCQKLLSTTRNMEGKKVRKWRHKVPIKEGAKGSEEK